ncbi:Protein LONGIFOLIA [Quillaja saponaria]|uniref:Protein LONGIFOLIA n=1 Tax=Quillaja saponaria TaxID=32244 RepID=A0AAD7LE46_QUISA|nr:Protein LONGIFOLIA [Quillaja saponaria]
MAAKLLHSLADDKPDLQKQIGCIPGIFQLFDRPHVLASRRLSHKRLPPGTSHFNAGSLERDSTIVHCRQTAAELSLNKGVNEKQRISTESSRASFSSSCSSSSLDCNKVSQQEASFDRIIFPETPSKDPVMNQPISSPQLGRQSLDLRDVVKDSMYREASGLALKTASKEEVPCHALKHRDSPRPFQLSNSVDGSYEVGVNGKQSVPVDLKESLKVLAKLRETPWYYNEDREPPRSSYEVKDGPRHSFSKDAPRFSYDGREIRRLSFESRDTLKSASKLKDLPRLSLDSREGSMRSSMSDSKPAHLSKSFQNNGNLNYKVSNFPQSSGTQKRPPSVVAKLMGLEALPESSLAGNTQSGIIETSSVEDKEPFSRPSKTNNLNRPIRTSSSPRKSLKDPTSPRWKNSDLVMKPISSSRFPIEPAPWKQLDGNQCSQKSSFRPIKFPSRTSDSFPSVYSEIERRLKDLEFKQSGRDLRALKQILEAMQSKGLLDTRKEEQPANFGSQRNYEPKSTISNQNSRSVRQQSPQHNRVISSTVGGSDSAKAFESPIVIMKPAKLVERSGIPASSVTSIDVLSGPHRNQSGGLVDNRKVLANGRMAKDHSPKVSRGDAAASSTEKRGSSRNMRSGQSLSRSQQFSKENSPSSVKNSGSVSPRLQQKKLELEKRSRPPTPPSDSNKPRRQSSRQAPESGSPGGKQRPKSSNLQRSDDQLSEISNESRTLSCLGDDSSLQSEDNTVLDLKTDMEVTSTLQSPDINDRQGLATKATNLVSGSGQMKTTPRLDEDGLVAELATVAPEHHSPVSVLDASIYRDDEPSPVKQIPNALKDDGIRESNDNQNVDAWFREDSISSNSIGSGLTSEINRKKLQSIDHLVQKLRRLNSSHDEARTDYIASLCENTNPDHRYVSEILLASGLLLRDLSSDLMTFQLHSSGHPINPELFFVLEQTKASSLLPKELYVPGRFAHSKLGLDPEKVHRKLIFDAVNEILGGKLALVGTSPEPWLKPNSLVKKNLSAQKLLKELCFEIEQIQTKESKCSLEDEEDNQKSILWEDVMHHSGSWTGFCDDIPGVVLDVERLIFKDLVGEIVTGEAAMLGAKQVRRRQLFAK